MKDDTLFWALCDIDEALILRAKEVPNERKTPRKPLRIILVAAAVLIALGAVTALAANTQLGRAIISWTNDVFWLEYAKEETPVVLKESEAAVLDDSKIASWLPKYIPEGYVQSELYTEEHSYTVSYQKDDEYVVFRVQRVDTPKGMQFEHDGETPEIYTSGGIDHAISTNMGNYTAVWENQGYECAIMGVCSKDELIRMIDSIYASE